VLFNGKLDIKGAYGPYRKSYDEGRGNADILQGYATYMARIGKFREAEKAIDRAATLDPLNPYTFRTMALVQYAAGNLNEATASVSKALSLDPDTGIANATLGDIAYLQGRYPQALDYFTKEPNSLLGLKGLAITNARLNKRSAAEKAMEDMVAEYGDNSLYQQAEILTQWGDTEDALDALEKARLIGDAGLVLARNDPQLAPLRSEKRFKALLLSLGFNLPQ
jgi:tetratricopeptide (TPR) repeat protein